MQDDNAGEESDKISEERVLPAEGSPIEEGGVVGSAEPHPRRWWVLAVMGLGVFMVFLDSAIVNTALPAISRDLGASTSTLQWVVNAYILMLAGLLLVGGTVGDRFGRRRWLGIGMVVFAAAAGAASLSPNAETLIAFRAIQGVGAAFILPATLSIITDVFPREERSKAIGIWTALGSIGFIAGPALGGVLVDAINWQAVFWMHLPIAALTLVGLRLVPESRDSRRLPLDISGAILGTGGLIALVFGIIQGPDVGWTSPEILGAFVLAAVALGAFFTVEVRSSTPMLPMRFFKQADFTGPLLVIGLMFLALIGMFFFLTLYFQLVQGNSAFRAGLFILPAAATVMVGAPIAGLLTKRFGPRIFAIIGALAMMLGMLWLAQLDVDSSYLTVVIGLVAFGLGVGLAMAPMTDTVMAAVPVNLAGIGSATNDVSRELGSALGIAILGSVVNTLYQGDVQNALEGAGVSAAVVDTVSEGIGVAVITAGGLAAASPELAATITDAANIAFVDAITTVFYVGAGFVGAAVLFALTLVPRKMRAQQAVLETPTDAPEEAGPATLPEPVSSAVARAFFLACAAAGGRVVGQGRCLCQPSPDPESVGVD